MPHVVVAGPLHPAGIEVLEAAPEISFVYETSWDPVAYTAHIDKADGLVLRTQALTRNIVDMAPRLKIVSRNGVGYDAVDVAALNERGIALAVVGDVNSATVAEHTIMLMLAASRRLLKTVVRLREGDWLYREELEARELCGKNLLIIGFGRIGRRVARIATALEMSVFAYDPFIDADQFEGANRISRLDDALRVADVISLHIPATDSQLLDSSAFRHMKPGVVIVNAARGSIVDEAALLSAVNEGRVGAFGTDVFAEEPPTSDHPFLSHQSIIATPHSAALTEECARRMARRAVQNVLDYFEEALDPSLIVGGTV